MANFIFSNEEASKLYEKKYQALQAAADSKADDARFLWDVTVQKYAAKMERVKRILNEEGIRDQVTTKIFKDIDIFLNKCADAEFHIALVGTINAGKSTLINALLGGEYAATKVTPETASLTKFRRGEDDHVKIVFYSTHEWDKLWQDANKAKSSIFLKEYTKLNAEKEKEKWIGHPDKTVVNSNPEMLITEIQKWTSSKSVFHYFVKEVEVALKKFELPDGVVLVDTPGLDDVVPYRSNITRDYIDRANAVLVCVKANALTGQEWATICSVFSNTRYNPGKVYIVATQLDTLTHPKTDWMEQKNEWIKYLERKSAYADPKLAEKNLIGVSAYLYILLTQYKSLTENDDRFWDLDSIIRKFRIKHINEHYEEMLSFTNIDLLKKKIQQEIVTNYKKILLEDITNSYNLCKNSIQEFNKKVKTAQQEIIQASQGSLQDIRNKQQEYATKCKEAEDDKKELENILNRLKTATAQKANRLEKAIKNLNN